MTPDLILLAILDGLSYAGLLFMVALGMTLVFGVMGILNMAHGSLYAFGGYAAASTVLLAVKFGLPPLAQVALLVLAAVVVGVLLGAIMESGLLRRIYDKPAMLQLLITFAAFMIFEDLQRMIWGTQPYSVSDIVAYFGNVDVVGITYTRYQLFVLPGVALAIFFALRWFLRNSSTGRQIVAVAHNREISMALGINVKRICLMTFVVGSVLGALGGALALPTTAWVTGIGAEMIVLSFAVVATAGLGQVEGTLVTAIIIGLARSFAVYLMPELEVLMPYLIMVLVLLFRPQGLFSVAQARRV